MKGKINSFYHLTNFKLDMKERHCKHSFQKEAIMWENIFVAYITEVNRQNIKTSPNSIRPTSQWKSGLRTYTGNSQYEICLVSLLITEERCKMRYHFTNQISKM